MTYANSIGVYLTRALLLLPRPRFGKFLLQEQIKHRILQAAKRKEEAFPELVISYVSAAFLIPAFILRNLRWEFLFLLFSLASSKSIPKVEIPLLKPNKQKDEKAAWDYEGRGYAMYVHIIASAYGWTQDKINNLDVDVALALVQEIITDEQLDREFLWSMSDKSYSYDYKTKVGRANPLERPYFMKTEVKPPEKTRIPKSMMPMGNVSWARTEADLRPNLPPPSAMRGM